MVASWMVDGEALEVMAVMISSNSPSGRVPERRLLIPILGFGTMAAERNSFSSSPTIFGVLGYKESSAQRRGPRATRGGHTTPRRGPGWGRAWARSGPPVGLLIFSFRLRGSSCSKTLFIVLFRIFPKVEFLHKKKTPKQFC